MRSFAARSLLLAAFLGGCPASHPPPDACAACGDAGARDLPVDLLFVVNVAGDDRDQAAVILETMPHLVARLVERGVDRIRAAVVTSDMGSGRSSEFPTCDGVGDDGLFLAEPRTGVGTCLGREAERVMSFDPRRPDEFSEALSCRASLEGSFSCQSSLLEAALKSVTGAAAGPIFSLATRGHGDDENLGLVERGDLLVIVLLTSRDDCSWAPRIVDDAGLTDCTPTGLEHLVPGCCDEALRPIERYLEGLPAAADALGVELAMVSLLPVPEALVPPAVPVVDYGTILADDRVRRGGDGCGAGLSATYASPRLVELTRRFGDAATLRSSCAFSAGRFDASVFGSVADWIADRARAE